MSGTTILGIAGSAVILLTLFEMMRRHRLREKYALIWALVALAVITVAVFPRLLVLASDAVEVGECAAGRDDPAAHQLLAILILVDLERAAVGHQQEFRAGLGEVGADAVLPDVLADRHAELHPPPLDRLG